MNRSRVTVATLVVVAVAIAAFSLGRRAVADGATQKIAYLFVSGKGPSAKAWYDGAPPAGLQVQAALNAFSGQGFHVTAISSSGQPYFTASVPAGQDPAQGADFVILLER